MATLATLFWDCDVQVRPRFGEGMEEARRRLRGVIEDSRISGITLQIRRPEEVDVEWRKVCLG